MSEIARLAARTSGMRAQRSSGLRGARALPDVGAQGCARRRLGDSGHPGTRHERPTRGRLARRARRAAGGRVRVRSRCVAGAVSLSSVHRTLHVWGFGKSTALVSRRRRSHTTLHVVSTQNAPESRDASRNAKTKRQKNTPHKHARPSRAQQGPLRLLLLLLLLLLLAAQPCSAPRPKEMWPPPLRAVAAHAAAHAAAERRPPTSTSAPQLVARSTSRTCSWWSRSCSSGR